MFLIDSIVAVLICMCIIFGPVLYLNYKDKHAEDKYKGVAKYKIGDVVVVQYDIFGGYASRMLYGVIITEIIHITNDKSSKLRYKIDVSSDDSLNRDIIKPSEIIGYYESTKTMGDIQKCTST